MDIVILGSGNVAAVLGRKFKAAGHHIVQIYSRNASAASHLAYEWDTDSTNYISLISREAEVYLVAVNDEAIAGVVADLRLPGKVVAHTAASVPADILKSVTDHYGVFYPLQSLRKEMTDLPEIPVYFDGHDAVAKSKLGALAMSISGGKATEGNDDSRLKLHVAAVVVSNFVNHLYVLAADYCRKEGIAFDQLYPLIAETANRIQELSPRDSQTGPALRHDAATIRKHLDLLRDHPQLRNIYVLLTESIQQVS
jgi:predicted short-subunit dehydrogenase-like oxidoreductase (DUF2520 family)